MKIQLAIVLLSGGMDSCVTAAIAEQTCRLAFLHVNYGHMVIGKPPAIRADDLPFGTDAGPAPIPGESLLAVVRAHIAAVLERYQWNITHAAEALGIDRATLYNKIKKYDLQRPR